MDKEREIIRLNGEIDTCKEQENYYKMCAISIKNNRLDYQDELKAVKKGKKYVRNKKRKSQWI